MAVIKGKLYYPNLRKPSSMSGKLQAELGNLDEESMQLLADADIPVSNKGDEKENYVTLKGNVDYPPKVVDSQKNPLPEPPMIGNGSEAQVILKPYDWTFKNKKGISAGLSTIMVTNLVPYTGGGGVDEFEVQEGGFTVDSSTPSTQPPLDDEIPFG